MKIEKFLINFKKQFEVKLWNYLDQKEKQAERLSTSYIEAIQEIKRLSQAGGKRLRPALVWLGFQANGGKDNREMWRACLGVELIHLWAIIHDDIMDNSFLRRGRQTTFKQCGLNKAILVGDLALSLADEITPLSAKKYFDLLKWEVIGGQWLDIDNLEFRIKNYELNLESRIIKTMELKTGRYSIARPLQIGLALSGKDNRKHEHAFFNYGVNLGIAFQIKDDLLGIFGKEKDLGKPIGSDIQEGKQTLLIAKLIKTQMSNVKTQSQNAKLKTFLRLFGQKKQLSKQELNFVKKLLQESGAVKDCEEEMEKRVEMAKKAIGNVKIKGETKKLLLEIGEYLIKRNK